MSLSPSADLGEGQLSSAAAGVAEAPGVLAIPRKKKRHTLTGRYVTLFSGEAFNKLCVALAFAYVARVLGPADFGRIELALSVTLFFILGIESGLGPYGARIVASEPARTGQLVARVIVLRGMLAIPAYLTILWISARYGMPGLGILAIYGLTVLFIPFYIQWVFQGMGHMAWVAAANVLRYSIFVVAVFLLLPATRDLRMVAVAEVLGVSAVVAFNAYALRHLARVKIDWQGVFGGAWSLFLDAWPLAVSQVAWVTLWYSPEVVLGLRATPEQVAWLAGPLRVVLAIHTFVWLYFFNLLPNLSKNFSEGLEAWRDLANRSLATTLWLSGLVAIGVTLLAPFVVTTIYGEAYAPAAWPLRIVVWMIPIAWLSGHFRYSLIATGHQRSEFYASTATGIVTAGLAYVLIPRGGSGTLAALVLLTGGIVNASLTALALERTVGSLHVLRALVRPVTAGALCLAAGFVIREAIGPLVGAAVSCLSFAAIALRGDPELIRLRQVWLGR